MNELKNLTNYEIYPSGEIYNVKLKRNMKHQVCEKGYHRVYLTDQYSKRKSYSVHRLVAFKYVKGRTNERCEINHIDGNKSNNHPTNLEWCTRKENMDHARNVLKVPMGRVIDSLKKEMVEYLLLKYQRKQVASLLKTSPENISRIRKTL